MENLHLPPELRELIRKVAAHTHGLGFLHRSYLESVAVTLGVHPLVVDAARAYLETPGGRSLMIEETRRAREQMRRNRAASSPAASAPPDEEPVKGARELIEEVRGHPLGIGFLRNAPPETLAVTFGVHPFVVFHAREIVRWEEGEEAGREPGEEMGEGRS